MANFPVFQVTEGEWKSGEYVDVLDFRIPVHFTPDPQLLCDLISSFQTRSDDVFVIGFPKSGTTWMQEIVWQIFNYGVVKSEKTLKRVPFLELGSNLRAPQPDINSAKPSHSEDTPSL
ncbi:hypothetical protein OS493_036336 [Desmophyllum pertusum]|uniref:Sulfotransferase domain-containing protein n=1 Tax=Desmophyllum pertusum TaxID=174260 RepID=A0A9W9YI40_9CNID|nr:hypothetical protein OS493_036336 [Desmophyllum pertusum]